MNETETVKWFRGETNCQEALDLVRTKWVCPNCGSHDFAIEFAEIKSFRSSFVNNAFEEDETRTAMLSISKVQCDECSESFNGVQAYDQALRR